MESRVIVVDEDIRLYELKPEHAQEIYNTIDSQREYLGEWLPFVEHTREVAFTQAFIDGYTLSDRQNLTFAIYFQGQFAGLTGLKDTDLVNRKTELGYWLSEPFQHKGIMARSCLWLIEHAFTKMGMNRIQLKAATGNAKSCRVAERLGFTLEGVERDGELHARGFVNLNVFSLLATEFDADAR